jgi:hypothetical protein
MKRNARKIRAHHKFSPAEISHVEDMIEADEVPARSEILKRVKKEKIAPVHRAKARNVKRFRE